MSRRSLEAGLEVTVEVIDGPMDGLVLGGTFERVSLGRAQDNDIALYGDRSVSGRHAHLLRAESGWLLEDRGSTNGTWIDGARLTTTLALAGPLTFLAGNAAIRCVPGASVPSYLPDSASVRAESERLLGRLSAPAAQGWGAALALALAERRGFVTDRNLFLGLIATAPELEAVQGGRGAITTAAIAAVRANAFWTGPEAWIDRHLRAVPLEAELCFASELSLTPRVLRILALAAERSGDAEVGAAELLRAVLDVPGRVPALLERSQVAVDAARERLAAEAAAGGERREHPALPPAKVAVSEPITSGDPALDARARDTAEDLARVASQYHLASADERRLALREQLSRAVAKVDAEARRRFLSQLERCFPVLEAGSADAGEIERLRGRIAELESRPMPAPAPARAPVAVPWRSVLSPDDAQLDGVGEDDRAAARFLAEILSHSTAIEQFIVGMITSLTARGRVTEVHCLPGWKTSIARYAQRLLEGKEVGADEVRDYLTALQGWLVAAAAAHHEGPELWFREFWKRINPAAIEAAAAEPGRKKVFRIEAVELWEAYKERVHAVTPELVGDEILVVVRKRAEEQFAKLRERSVT